MKKVYKVYNNGIENIRVYEGAEVPEGFVRGRYQQSWNKGLTKDTDDRVKRNSEAAHSTLRQKGYTAWNKGLTKEMDPRLKGLKGSANPMYGKHPTAWNKGLTKETNDIVKQMSENHKGVVAWNKGLHYEGTPRSEAVKEKIRQTHLTKEVKEKRFNTMKRNGNLGKNKFTKAEQKVYGSLLEQYAANDIISQYFDKERYPYVCDFYIKSKDLFIEVNVNWTHGSQPYDINDPECQARLSLWQERAKYSNYYKNAIYTWTDLDVRKQQCASNNNLNYKVIYTI